MRWRRSSHPFFLGIVIGLVVAGVLGGLVVAPLMLLHRSAGDLEAAYGNVMVGLVARLSGAAQRPSPISADAQTLEQARESYTGACSQCHGADGNGHGLLGMSTFPPATDLTGDNTQALSDAQLFAIIKNGLGFTSMPAYSQRFTDTEIWTLVDFIRALQRGQSVALPVPTPSTDQLAYAHDAPAADARHGAALYAAFGCAACHEPAGDLSIHPGDDAVARVLRTGQPGMPCFAPELLTDTDIADIQAYIATFPQTGVLGSEDAPGAPRPVVPPGPRPTPLPRPCTDGLPNPTGNAPGLPVVPSAIPASQVPGS